MHPHLPPSSLLFIGIFTFFFLGAPISLGNDDRQHTACKTSVFKCGDIKNVTYPFWGGDRPDYCGHPQFGLRCNQGNYTVIDMMSVTYRVLSVNQINRSLVIARPDLLDDPCTYNYINTTLDQSLFSQSSNTGKVALFYNCSSCDNSTNLIPGVSLKNIFICPLGNGEGSDACFVYDEYISPFREVADGTCQKNTEVPLREPGHVDVRRNPDIRVLQRVLKEGFEVVYTEAIIDACVNCGVSGGSCGRNLESQQPVCFCRDLPYPQTCSTSSSGSSDRRNLRRKLLTGFLPAGFLLVVTTVVICWFIRKTSSEKLVILRKKGTKNGDVEAFLRNHGSLAQKRYKYSAVKKMTNSFKDKLGQGGYGGVYKGKLIDGRLVAVKVLSESKGNGEEFINEVASISKTSHVNVVNLLGFCFEGSKRALIYEFMPNGSLEKIIYDEQSMKNRRLGWETLHQIAVGIAQGLEYLHRGCNTRILHFDIKPHNILLDEDFCPKISDFGLAKLCTRKESIISMLGARGTAGYIAPEVLSRNFGGVSHKSDVYSYGMMVLEMVGGRKNIDVGVDKISEIYFPHWIYKNFQHSGHLRLHGIFNEEDDKIARKMVLVGLWCIQNNPSDRPSISKVLEMLEGSLESIQIPPKPFLSSPSRSEEGSPARSTS